MKPIDFVHFLRGFVTACHEYQPTPKQWDTIKEVLEEVDLTSGDSYIYHPIDLSNVTFSSGTGTKQQLND